MMKIKHSILMLGSIFLFFNFAYAKNLNYSREKFIFEELDKFEEKTKKKTGLDKSLKQKSKQVSSRYEIIEQALRDISIELAFEYAFALEGEQTFELVLDGELLSRLNYPFEGNLFIFKTETGYLSKIFLATRYATSKLKRTICTDEDWSLYLPGDYQISYQDCKTKLDFFDIDLYYRLLDLKRKELHQKKDYTLDELFDNLMVDEFNLDVFGGYQRHNARYRMVDPMRALFYYVGGSMFYDPTLPDDIGLDSFYKIKYRGPKLGLRIGGSKGKFSSRVWLAHLWLKTDAYGYWNLRDYKFWHEGKDGHGLDFGLELNYNFNPVFSLGLGFNYFEYRQKKMKASGIQPGFEYYDEDIIRNTNTRFYYPSLIIKYLW